MEIFKEKFLTAKNIGIIFLFFACVQIYFSIKIYQLKKMPGSEEVDLKIKKINRVSVWVQVVLLAGYGVFIFW